MSRRGKGLRDEQIRDIYRYTFNGLNFPEIAGRIGCSAPTVRNYFIRFVSEAERSGLMPTARSYGVEGQVQELIDVRKELNNSGLEPSECVAGSRVVKILRDLGVEESDFADFTGSVYVEVVAQGLKPKEFVNSAAELRRLRRLTGKGYQAILDDYESRHEVNERLKVENTSLEEERRQLKNQLDQEVREKDATLETLKWYDDTKKTLKEYGVAVEALDSLSVLLSNVSEKSYDPDDIIEFYSTTRDLEEHKRALGKNVSALTSEETDLQERNNNLQEIIKNNQDVVESINEINSLEISVENLGEILQKVTEISSRHGMNKKEALERFFSDIKEQYEPKLGYQNELNRLQARKSRLSEENTDLKADLDLLEKRYTEKKGVLDRLVSLNVRGVTNEDLIHWDEILAETEIDLIMVRREISQLGGLRQWFDEKNKDKMKLEGEIEALTREIDTLKIQKKNYETELTSLTTGALAEAKREITRLPGIIDDLRRDLLDPETGLKIKSLKMVDETHKAIEDLLEKKEKQWTQLLQQAQNKISEMDTLLENLQQATYNAGEMMGQYKAIEPIHRLQSGEDPGFHESLTAMLTILVPFRNWFSKYVLTDGTKAVDNIITVIARELRDPERIRVRKAR